MRVSSELLGDCFQAATGDVRHLDRVAIWVTANAAPRIRDLFALSRHVVGFKTKPRLQLVYMRKIVSRQVML
jgi:hypothetical protein